jgi:hypothetical protein
MRLAILILILSVSGCAHDSPATDALFGYWSAQR